MNVKVNLFETSVPSLSFEINIQGKAQFRFMEFVKRKEKRWLSRLSTL